MHFVSEDGLSVKIQVVVVSFEFLVVFNAFEGVNGFGDVTGHE